MGRRRIHDLKIEPQYWHDIVYGNKGFEVRKNDRDYKVGDYLHLKEYEDGKYTGRMIEARVNYITPTECIGLKKNYVVMNLLVLSARHNRFDETV